MSETIGDRIKILVDLFSGGNKSKFAREVNSSEPNIRNYISGTNPKSDVLSSILSCFTEISPDWLISGKGEMYRAKNEKSEDSKNEEQNKSIRAFAKSLEEAKRQKESTNEELSEEDIHTIICTFLLYEDELTENPLFSHWVKAKKSELEINVLNEYNKLIIERFGNLFNK